VYKVNIRRLLAFLSYFGAAGLAVSAVACDSNADTASAALARGPGNNGDTAGQRQSRQANGEAGPRAPGGRPVPTITLAPGDLATVTREAIDEATPITGDLGQLLARFESSEQESGQRSAEADRASARSDLATAQWNLDQSAELFKAGAIAERDYKIAQQAVDAAKARLAASEARLRSASIVAQDTRVLAPSAGIIDKRNVENGERVTRGTSMFTMVRNDLLELAAALPAKQAAGVRVGQSVSFVADARSFTGRVARISPTIDPASRSITVYVEVPNTNHQLRGGTFATGRVISRTLADALTVPTAAVKQSQEAGHPFVYRIEGKVVNIAEIQLGVIDERLGKAQVLTGLEPGDRVIVGNVGTLGRGMQVQIIGSEQGGRGASRGTGARQPGSPRQAGNASAGPSRP
jgi:membrane fusion protein (multidrug efflux system)